MKDITRLQTLIYRGKSAEAREHAQLMLATGAHPLRIVRESVVPAVEQSAAALEAGLYHANDLPALGRTLQGVLAEIATSLRDKPISLQFGIGPVRCDALDLWGSIVRNAFQSAGFATFETPEINRCKMIGLCQVVNSVFEKAQRHTAAAHAPPRGASAHCEFVAQA